MGYITDVRYLDDVESMMKARYRRPYKKSVFDLTLELFGKNISSILENATQLESYYNLDTFSLTSDEIILDQPGDDITHSKNSLTYSSSRDKFRIYKDFLVQPRRKLKNISLDVHVQNNTDEIELYRNESQNRIDQLKINVGIPTSQSSNMFLRNTLADITLFTEEQSPAAKELFKRLEPSVLPGNIYLRKMRKGNKILSGLKIREVY